MKKWKGKADFTVERLGHEKGRKKSMRRRDFYGEGSDKELGGKVT